MAEGDYRNTACLGLLVIKFQYPFKIFTACHNRIFMFCSAKVTWFMQNASEAIECLPVARTRASSFLTMLTEDVVSRFLPFCENEVE